MKIILYIATSQDGFIADKKGGIGWLPHPKDAAELEVVGYKELMARIDTILMGSRSYKQIIEFGEWGWPDKKTYVFTSRLLESDKPYIRITHDSPVEFVSKLKACQMEQSIWLLGGSQLAKSFHKEGFIDEIILTIVPQVLGEGIPLGLDLNDFRLVKEKFLADGLVQKKFLRKELSCLQ